MDISPVKIVNRVVRVVFNSVTICKDRSFHGLRIFAWFGQMIVTETHVVVVEGKVFSGSLAIVNESFFSRLGFLKAIKSVFILLYIEKA